MVYRNGVKGVLYTTFRKKGVQIREITKSVHHKEVL